jgi:outer membrane protein
MSVAWPVHAANLSEFLEMARTADAQFAAARAAADAGREKSVQGRAGLLPSVTLTGNARNNHERGGTSGGVRNYDSGLVSINVNQPLFRKVNWETYQQGELQALLSEQQLNITQQELLLRVAKGYFEVLQAQDALTAVQAQKEAFAQQLAQARRSFEVGLSPVTDVNEAQARHDLTLAQEIAARNDIELKKNALEKIIDREAPPLALLSESAPINVLSDARLKELLERAGEGALQVAASITNERIARHEVARQVGAQLPTLDLVASISENRNGNFSSFGPSSTKATTVGLELSVPLPFGQGQVGPSRVREALANLERAGHELANAKRQARLDARQAALGVESGNALHLALQRALESAQTQLRSTTRGFEVGVRSRVDVLNAQQQLYATKKDLAASRYQVLLAGLQLKAAAGTLTDEDLKALDALLR